MHHVELEYCEEQLLSSGKVQLRLTFLYLTSQTEKLC